MTGSEITPSEAVFTSTVLQEWIESMSSSRHPHPNLTARPGSRILHVCRESKGMPQ